MLEIVNETVLYSSESGTFKKIRRWVRGWHPKLGKLLWGYTGQETEIDIDVICSKTFMVYTYALAKAA